MGLASWEALLAQSKLFVVCLETPLSRNHKVQTTGLTFVKVQNGGASVL